MEYTDIELKNEQWKDIFGYDGMYQVSSFGRVRSLKFGKTRVLKGGTTQDGYLTVLLYKDGKRKGFTVHRLVANTFIPNSDESKTEVNHINACKTALDQERNEGKAFDEEKYIKAFEQYAFGLDKLSDETDDDGNRFGDYQYIKSKEWMKPFGKKSDATTREICERYLSIQANRQAVVNA